jgi:hypothetical protein
MTQAYLLALPPDVFKDLGESIGEFQRRVAIYRLVSSSNRTKNVASR